MGNGSQVTLPAISTAALAEDSGGPCGLQAVQWLLDPDDGKGRLSYTFKDLGL